MSSDSSDVGSWEGLPLELEPPEGVPLGEETISRPIEELVPSGPYALRLATLARWMLLCSASAVAFSLASVFFCLLAGGAPVPWQGGLLAFDCAVVVLVLRSYLMHGTPARTVCHWVLSLVGLVAAAFVIQVALVRSAAHIVAWPPPPVEALTALFACGLLGLAGIIVFVECLQRRRWASRSAAAASVAFLVLVLLQAFTRAGAAGRTLAAVGGLPAVFWAGLAAAVLGAVAFVTGWQRRRAGERAWAWQLLAAGGAALLVAGAVLGGAGGAQAAARRAWHVAVLWEAAALLPLAVPGVAIAWRQPGPLRDDVLEATQFLWVLVALGVVAMVGVWLPTHLSVDLLHMGLVAGAMSALVTGAWLGARRGDWAGRWVLVPTGALTVLVLCALGQLRSLTARLYPTGSALWTAAVMLSWCALAVGLVFATAGLAVKRSRPASARAGGCCGGTRACSAASARPSARRPSAPCSRSGSRSRRWRSLYARRWTPWARSAATCWRWPADRPSAAPCWRSRVRRRRPAPAAQGRPLRPACWRWRWRCTWRRSGARAGRCTRWACSGACRWRRAACWPRSTPCG